MHLAQVAGLRTNHTMNVFASKSRPEHLLPEPAAPMQPPRKRQKAHSDSQQESSALEESASLRKSVVLVADGADVVEAWRRAKFRDGHTVCHIVHCRCEPTPEVLVALGLLDRIRNGQFHAVLLIPDAATCSRARHIADDNLQPLRSRSHPVGLTANDVQDNEKVIRANRHVEIAIWLGEQALS